MSPLMTILIVDDEPGIRRSLADSLSEEGYGAIKARRGKLTIIDREKLLKFAGSAYGPTEAEYQRLIGRLTRSANT